MSDFITDKELAELREGFNALEEQCRLFSFSLSSYPPIDDETTNEFASSLFAQAARAALQAGEQMRAAHALFEFGLNQRRTDKVLTVAACQNVDTAIRILPTVHHDLGLIWQIDNAPIDSTDGGRWFLEVSEFLKMNSSLEVSAYAYLGGPDQLHKIPIYDGTKVSLDDERMRFSPDQWVEHVRPKAAEFLGHYRTILEDHRRVQQWENRHGKL